MSLNLATVFKPPATISLTITARPLRRWIEPSSGSSSTGLWSSPTTGYRRPSSSSPVRIARIEYPISDHLQVHERIFARHGLSLGRGRLELGYL